MYVDWTKQFHIPEIHKHCLFCTNKIVLRASVGCGCIVTCFIVYYKWDFKVLEIQMQIEK